MGNCNPGPSDTMKPGIQYRQQAFLHMVLRNPMTITAKYEDGVFKPLEDVTVNEGTIIERRPMRA